jgi:hypothetical protein
MGSSNGRTTLVSVIGSIRGRLFVGTGIAESIILPEREAGRKSTTRFQPFESGKRPWRVLVKNLWKTSQQKNAKSVRSVYRLPHALIP